MKKRETLWQRAAGIMVFYRNMIFKARESTKRERIIFWGLMALFAVPYELLAQKTDGLTFVIFASICILAIRIISVKFR